MQKFTSHRDKGAEGASRQLRNAGADSASGEGVRRGMPLSLADPFFRRLLRALAPTMRLW